MNEQVRAVWNKAAASHTQGSSSRETQENFLNRFAELIVKECCYVLESWKSEPFPFDEDVAVSLIKEHFGVKQ